MLPPNPQPPIVPQPAMRADLLQPLQILTQLAIHRVGQDLLVLTGGDVALAVEEPGWYLVLRRGLDDGDDALKFFGGEFAGAKGPGGVRYHFENGMGGCRVMVRDEGEGG